jgi:hypothetical protein
MLFFIFIKCLTFFHFVVNTIGSKKESNFHIFPTKKNKLNKFFGENFIYFQKNYGRV